MGIIEALIGAAVATAAAGTAYSVVSGEQAKKAQQDAMGEQKRAQAEQAQQAAAQQARSERRMAVAAQREPNVQGIMAAAQQTQGGPSSTMLTGPTGVNPQDLALGRSTLLGG